MTTSGAVYDRPRNGVLHGLTHRDMESYPDTGTRMFQLFLVVLVTVALYYESYVGGSVSTLLLTKLHMSFSFYVMALAFGNLLGAFSALLGGISDRVGRANLVVVGLLITGLATLFVIPALTSKWPFIIVTFAVGIVEGVVLVATPALVRDFSPQTRRATAMGFWTMGPVLGSLVVSIVGSSTINANTQWQHEYRICGVAGLVVFVIVFFCLRELAPSLRDQLMVSVKDRVLIEARAKGIDIEESLRHPYRQMLRADIIISAIGVSVLLLAYYTAVGFGTIIFTTIFGFSLKDANGLGNWTWAADAVALIVVGVVSDRVRVRKPFMILGGVGAAVTIGVFLSRFGHTTGYYEVALIVAVLSVFLAFAYGPWMASFTETVEARNPALTATGLGVWGWLLRIVVFLAFIILPHVVTTATPLVTYGSAVSADAAHDKTEIAFAQSHASLIAFAQSHASLIAFVEGHPTVVATATKYGPQLAAAQKFAPELAVIEANPTLFGQLAAYPNAASIPPALLARAVAAAGGGAKGAAVLGTIDANKAAIEGVIAVAPQLRTLTPYATQLKALAANATQLTQLKADASQLAAVQKAAPALTFLAAHATAVESAAKHSPGQWKDWYWACIAACVFFLGSVPLMRGRWSPKRAREDEEAHEQTVQEEMNRLDVG